MTQDPKGLRQSSLWWLKDFHIELEPRNEVFTSVDPERHVCMADESQSVCVYCGHELEDR
jgi:hypothetical protein